MRIIITGATGFIGKQLIRSLLQEGYEAVVLSRDNERARKVFGNEVLIAEWDGKTGKGWTEYVEGAYGIINLAGENIGAGRWTAERKERILRSRLSAGAAVSDAIKAAKKKPIVLIQASAIGYYGSRGDELLDEQSSQGEGFLAEVVKQWETSTTEIEIERRIVIRTAVVIGPDGGVLQRLMMPFKYYAGGTLGSGKQWFSWIYIQDQVSSILHLLKKGQEGIFNLSAPEPVRMRQLCSIIAKITRRPCWLPMPSFMLKLMLGQMAQELLLTSQRIIPRRLLDTGYQYACTNIEDAIKKSS